MAKIGYLFLSRNLQTRDEDIAWMKEFGCKTILEEDSSEEKYRPQWRRMLTCLKHDDEIVITKFSNALRGIRELGVFLDLCQEYHVRIVSIHDSIDSWNHLFVDTSVGDVLNTIGSLSAEAMSIRRAEVPGKRKSVKQRTAKRVLRQRREKTIIGMYNSGHSIDDIWRVSGYKSRTSVFRVLNRNGVSLNRGHHSGPIKKRSDREEQ